MKHLNVLFLTLLCIYSSQAKSINLEFSETISKIIEKVDEAEIDFHDFAHKLLEDLAPFFKDLHSIEVQLDALPESVPCVQNLREQFAKLKNKAVAKIFKRDNAKLVEVLAIYDKAAAGVKACYVELHSYHNFYACDDIECKMAIMAKAEDQFKRAIVGKKFKDIKEMLQAHVVDVKEIINARTQKYLPRLAKILKSVESCETVCTNDTKLV